ncbi:MAG: hypothetical protein ACYC2K_00675 [Gemmatimonadales bacterium]
MQIVSVAHPASEVIAIPSAPRTQNEMLMVAQYYSVRGREAVT